MPALLTIPARCRVAHRVADDLDRPGDVGAVGDVQAERGEPAAGVAAQCRSVLGAPDAGKDAKAERVEVQRGGTADPGRRAGDNDSDGVRAVIPFRCARPGRRGGSSGQMGVPRLGLEKITTSLVTARAASE